MADDKKETSEETSTSVEAEVEETPEPFKNGDLVLFTNAYGEDGVGRVHSVTHEVIGVDVDGHNVLGKQVFVKIAHVTKELGVGLIDVLFDYVMHADNR